MKNINLLMLATSPSRLFKKSLYERFLTRQRRLKRRLTKYVKDQYDLYERISLRTKFIYFTIYRKLNMGLYPAVAYNAYQGKLIWIKLQYLNVRYHRRVKFIRKRNAKTRYFRTRIFMKTLRPRITLLHHFLYLYTYFLLFINVDLYYLTKGLKLQQQGLNYFLIFSFATNRLFINLQTFARKNFFFLSTGLFIRFFKRKKSFKKSKTIKLLMAKFLRKVFLVSRIRNSVLIVRKTPLYLLEMLNVLNTAIPYKFADPTEERVIDEKLNKSLVIKFLYFVFLESKNYTFNKQKKRGRIKRKIFRKLVFANKIID